jgi:hypothetical protein
MGNTLGKVPDVTSVQLLRSPAAVLVDRREEKRAFVDKAPFSLPAKLMH